MSTIIIFVGIIGGILLVCLIPGLYFNYQTKQYDKDIAKIDSADADEKTISYLIYQELTKIKTRTTIIVVIMIIPIILNLIQLTIVIDKIVKIEDIVNQYMPYLI